MWVPLSLSLPSPFLLSVRVPALHANHIVPEYIQPAGERDRYVRARDDDGVCSWDCGSATSRPGRWAEGTPKAGRGRLGRRGVEDFGKARHGIRSAEYRVRVVATTHTEHTSQSASYFLALIVGCLVANFARHCECLEFPNRQQMRLPSNWHRSRMIDCMPSRDGRISRNPCNSLSFFFFFLFLKPSKLGQCRCSWS